MIAKLSIIILVSTALSTRLYAQIPNDGFENWSSIGSYENPDNWATLNDLTNSLGVYTATKGTPGIPGSSFLKLTSKNYGPGVINGIAVCGAIDPNTLAPISGFPYAGQPVALTGKWQHMIFGSSQGSVSATLTRWDSATNARITVATANQTLVGMDMSWVNFSIPFVYTDVQLPDSCIIVLKASGDNPTNMDYLWVDGLSFSYSTAAIHENQSIDKLRIFPNPVADILNLDIPAHMKDIELRIADSYGRTVLKVNNLNNAACDVSCLPKGYYFLSIKSMEETFISSFIKN